MYIYIQSKTVGKYRNNANDDMYIEDVLHIVSKVIASFK